MSSGVDAGTISGRIEFVDVFSATFEAFSSGIEKIDGAIGGLGESIAGQVSRYFEWEAAIEVVKGGIEGLKDAVADMTVEGAKTSEVEASFDRLSLSSGVLGSTLLGTVREGLHGAVDDLTIMKTANQDVAAGLQLSTDQWKELSQGAFALAKSKGDDVNSTLETINDALLTGRTRGLAYLTGRIDLTAAEEAYASKLGGTREQLTQVEKSEADRGAIFDALGSAMSRIGTVQEGLDDAVEEGEAKWENFEHQLGATVATSPVLAAGLEGIKDALGQAFGGNQQTLIDKIANAIDNAAITALEFAQDAVTGAATIVKTWDDVKILFQQMAQWLLDIDEYAGEAAVGIAKMTGSSPDQIKQLNDYLGLVRSQISELDQDINGNAKNETDWANATQKINDQIEIVKERMEAVAPTAREHNDLLQQLRDSYKGGTDIVTDFAAAQAKSGETLKQTADEMKKMATAQADLNALGTSTADTLSKINPDTLALVENYKKLGASNEDLQVAFGLTATQMKAVTESMKENSDAEKQLQKDNEDSQKRWADYYDTLASLSNSTTQKQDADINKWVTDQIAAHVKAKTDTADFYAWVSAESDLMRQKDDQNRLESDQNSKAYWDKQAANAEDYYQFAEAHSDQFTADYIESLKETAQAATDTAAHWQSALGGALDNVSAKVNQLENDMTTLDNEGKALNAGYTVGAVTQETIDETQGGADTLLKQLKALQSQVGRTPTNIDDAFRLFQQKAELNALQDAYSLLVSQAKNPKADLGLNIPSFAEGGSGDFGTGTLAILHGKETIIPEKLDGSNGNITNNFLVNGTGADVAKQVSTILMNQLKQRRQFSAS